MDLIQNELINKAFTLGFKSYFGLMTSVNKECYHLWMADFKKWLREVHKIHITIDHVDTTTNYYYDYALVTANDREYNDEDFVDQAKHHYHWGKEFEFKTYELALEAGLQEALKLI